jgi:hypothetical protein
MPKKPKIGTRDASYLQEKKILNEPMRKRLDMRRRKYAEVRGKIVDYISHSIDDGILCMNVRFKNKTLFSFPLRLRHVYRGSRSQRLED